MDWFALGKKRSKFGQFLDKNKIEQDDLVKASKVSKSTISRLCQPFDFQPQGRTWAKIKKALKDKFKKEVDYDDFWPM